MFSRHVFGNISGGFRGITRFLGISRKYLKFAGPRPREISEALLKSALICFCFSQGDRKSKIVDDDSDRGSEASSGSRSKKSNGRASTKSKGSKKKAVEIADEDSDASQASGKSTKKKPAKNAGKTKKERTVVKKKKKERKKSTGERCVSLLQF